MIHLHLLGWMLGALALLGIIIGLRDPSVILFRLSPSHRTKSLAVACCTGLGLLGALLAVSSMPLERRQGVVPVAAKPAQMVDQAVEPAMDVKMEDGGSKLLAELQEQATSGSIHGNVQSRIFHLPECRNYDCKSCTQAFHSREAALAAGYRPCKQCIGNGSTLADGSPQ